MHRRAARVQCSLCRLLDRPSRAAPQPPKRSTRVKNRQRKHCQDDHRPFQYHERNLIIGNWPIETLLQLRNTVDRPTEDKHNSRSERALEPSEPFRISKLDEVYVPGALAHSAEAEYEFQPQSHKNKQRDNLEHHPGNHDGPSCFARGVGIGRGSEPAASTLKDERDAVARHECDCVGARAELRDVSAVNNYYAREAEVESSGQEGGADCQRDEVTVTIVRTLLRHSWS